MLLDFFELREQPFSVSPHPSYLYSSRSRSEALESLAHAAASPCGLFALLGAPGVGKTTLVNEFLASRLPGSTRAILLPHTPFSAAELVDYLSSEIGTARPNRASPPNDNTLHELLSREMRDGRSYLLVGDCAEQFEPPVLETICRLADSHSGLSVILAGKPSLQDRLQRNPCPLSFAAKFLEPLSGPETAGYIQHRLRIAGYPGIGLFERESLALIAELSQGIPRHINQICFRALLEGYASGCRALSPEIVEKAAHRLELGEAPQSVRRLPAPEHTTLSGGPRVMPKVRSQTPMKIPSPVFLSQPLLRRAAVAALALTTLALPYLAAKRISESIRPGASAATSGPENASRSANDGSSDVSSRAAARLPQESANRPPSSSERVRIATSPPSLTPTSHGSNPDAPGLNRARDGVESVAAINGARFSLARELGLKINRIAIDAGHGGYDTGTVGPSGLTEKDLCLDVALRLGRMIKENVPGAEVVYTRTDDRHVPLEERTAIANDAQADLFISIHANSSGVRQIRGVETYYVSLDGSPEAREIVTRENSVGDASLHNLSELIGRITRNENLAESRQLAADIQNSLTHRLQLVSRQEADRGVKRAPFIVLTGANMPAVLSEISFLSNPADEKLLTETEQRQRVTEGLYRGILAYLGTMPSRSSQPIETGSASAGMLVSTSSDGRR